MDANEKQVTMLLARVILVLKNIKIVTLTGFAFIRVHLRSSVDSNVFKYI
jgi:hypothetical protein